MADQQRTIAGNFFVGTALGIASIAAAGVAVAGIIIVLFARIVITPPRTRIEDVHILAVGTTTITLSATLDSLTPGRYSLWFHQDAGHARVGEIFSYTDTTVTRKLIAIDFGDIQRATRARFGGWYYLSPRELGYPFENVEVETSLGGAPAWLIPAEQPSTSWVIQVHGRAVRRSEALRSVPVFRDAGYTSLLISYRNDQDAPRSVDYRYGLGDTEWLDVESAIQFALDHGAKDVVLMGWSMGGATVLQAATRSPLSSAVRGIVLDSPVVDWVTALQYQGAANRVPPLLRRAIIATISSWWGRALTGQAQSIDLERLDFVRRASELRWPILLLHSDDDGFVPATASRALAVARPDIVSFEAFTTARHTKLWNYDSVRWNAAISRWLGSLR